MHRKCYTCLCQTCLNTCCDHKSCTGGKKVCENYNGFRQISIFEQSSKLQYQSAPRHSWEYYGISKERCKKLTEYIQSGKYTALASQAAYAANEMIAEHILLSAKENKSYDTLRAKWELKEIDQIPYGRTDF